MPQLAKNQGCNVILTQLKQPNNKLPAGHTLCLQILKERNAG
jgi:hypothetical protein